MKNLPFFYLFILFALLACDNTKPLHSQEASPQVSYKHPIPFQPTTYVCFQTNNTIQIDGKLNEADWKQAPNTKDFVDIQGAIKPTPPLKTTAKLLWDKEYLYIAMTLEEPHLWATLKERDAIIFQDDAIEIFIDPDGDGHHYCEIQVNAFNAVWDLLLVKPYHLGSGPKAITNWDVAGMQTAVSINGTLNKSGDMDEGWIIEMAIPWSALKELTQSKSPPKNGDQWRINLSRVDWLMDIVANKYQKQTNPKNQKPKQEQYYVWSPQGKIALHHPETWGFVQFSQKQVGEGSVDFKPNPDEQIKWALWQLHYQQTLYTKKHGKNATSLQELSKVAVNLPNYEFEPIMENYSEGYQIIAPTSKGNKNWVINEEGQILKKSFLHK